MRELLTKQNIERFRSMLAAETDARRKVLLQELLQQEEAKLRAIRVAGTDQDNERRE